MQFWEPQNYGERGGEHVECPLTTLERIQQSYEQRLRTNWTPDGKQKPSYSGVPLGIPVVYGHSEHGITLAEIADGEVFEN